MTLKIKEKFSFKKRFEIYNEQEQIAYYVEGKAFSFVHKIHIYDANHQEVAYLQQVPFSFHSKYEIMYRQNTYEMRRKLMSFRPHYFLDALNWEVTGDFMAHNYEISAQEGTTMIARIHQDWLTFMDAYSLDVILPEHEILCLCIMIAIDCIEDAAAASSAAT